ncbi:hypothetical protein EG328_001856 [Venturia inaequalis]|uniref:Uncharacterized protein n=1 Tax=Venturia inaequalis TaxID=5025 RepID=A0A8H3UW33_VENIN|nr:hypothetical protein EG328_001856 [Venturia inaequalis]
MASKKIRHFSAEMNDGQLLLSPHRFLFSSQPPNNSTTAVIRHRSLEVQAHQFVAQSIAINSSIHKPITPTQKEPSIMHFTKVITLAPLLVFIIATLLVSIIATPINLTPSITQSSVLDKRITNENICVVLCKDSGYRDCYPYNSCAMAGICVAMNDELSRKVSSVVIEYGHECTFWTSHVCNGGRSGHVQFDQSSSLGGFDNLANSYSCWKQPEDMT